MQLLPPEFYQRDDVVQIARDLIGRILWVKGLDGHVTAGRIVETEAYCHRNDRACHAYLLRKTQRNQTMYAPGGTSYVYLCYGIHCLLNVVCNQENIPDAVLIRAIEPLQGVEYMAARRKISLERLTQLGSGPGKLTKALGIDLSFDGENFFSERIQILDDGLCIASSQLIASPRVGIDYAGPDALLPWRFRLAGSQFVSPAP